MRFTGIRGVTCMILAVLLALVAVSPAQAGERQLLYYNHAWGTLDRVTADAVALEMCPRSNVQTRAVASLSAHPINWLLRRGTCVTVSTDGRTTCGTTVTEEFDRLGREFGWARAEFLACQRNAARAAFLPEAGRERLLRRLEA